ncbi:MAG TPA: PAS domain S-box protein [Candidatus Limnocylindria bacterium]|nr:PAS domain S-box protein [Candidatus Limnocylindria bacterium]
MTEPGETGQTHGRAESVFESFFERSVDAVWLLDPQAGVFVDCNRAAVELIGADSREQLLRMRPEELSPPRQLDGTPSPEKAAEIIAIIQRQQTHRFEWLMRRRDGRDVPIEVSATVLVVGGKEMQVIISRDISERKAAEHELRELNQSLERRVTERTAALTTSEARFRALVEHAPEAIVVLDGDTGRFFFGNEHACRLYGVPMEKLAELTPTEVSPEFQPDGQRSSELAGQWMAEVLAGGRPVFEWMHQQPDGRLIPTEVRLLRLPAEGQNLIRASIIDNTGRKQAERALRESEEKFRALFEGSSHGVVLHDDKQLLEVNSAAVRLFGCERAEELLGQHPGSLAPDCQPNGESSALLAARHIEECMVRGGVRFEWLARAPSGREIPMEVALTRIEWSGRQIIQAYITDITERTRAQTELAESEARFSVAFQASPIFIAISRASDGRFVLVNDAFVRWAGYSREEMLGRNALELGMWEAPEERSAFFADLHHAGSLRERECRFRDRAGRQFTILASAELIQLNHVPHMLVMSLDITERKRAEAELRAGEARLRESETRFSAAFHASPAFLGILRMSDEKYVLANDAYLNWLGYPREEVVGRTCVELGLWDSIEDRDLVLQDMRRFGAIRQRECHWRNRAGERFTVLLSAETINLNETPHMLSMATDITQRKRAEDELRKTLEREKELSQLKSNFVSMVSHEFRTPLGIIQSSAELLREFHPKMQSADREAHLESIARNTRRMAGMMEGVLVLSRLEAGKLDFRPAALDLHVFCRRVVDEARSATNGRCPIELALGAFPAGAEADEQLLGHILTNLLSNAVKYSEPGALVSFSVERKGRHLVCIVRDQGIGIPEEDQQQIFEAFHRGGNVGTRPGTGLGLLLVKRCADLHGGTVEVESRMGQGTTVTVTLPVFSKES